MKVCLCIMMGIVCLTGCQKKKPILKLKQDIFQVELGNSISLEALNYINRDGIENDDLDDIKKKAVVEIVKYEEPPVLGDVRRETSYENIGEYKMKMTYDKQVLSFKVRVTASLQPVILGPNILAVQKGEKPVLESYYHAFSYALKDDHHIVFDDSKVNYNKPGDYLLEISCQDSAYRKSTRSVTIRVQNKVDYALPPQVLLDVPYYNQIDVKSPNGCEATALYMALAYKNKIDIGLPEFIYLQSRSTSPYDGFSGDPFKRGKAGEYFTIFPQPFIQFGKEYSEIRNISTGTIDQIIDELANDHPVVVWVTGGFKPPVLEQYYFGKCPKNIHIMLVHGYDLETQTFYIKDPSNKDNIEVSFEDFQKSYNALKFAVAVE